MAHICARLTTSHWRSGDTSQHQNARLRLHFRIDVTKDKNENKNDYFDYQESRQDRPQGLKINKY